MMKNSLRNNFRSIIVFGLIIFQFTFLGCNKSNELEFTPNFSFNFKDGNHVEFINESSGEYYFLTWDFGNGNVETTTDKKKSFVIYYPNAADYTVSLRLTNYTGENKSTSKAVNISASDLQLSFTTEVNLSNPNYILLKNTSKGEYDSFKWIFRETEINDEMEYQAYFPFAGNYEVTLEVSKNNETFSTSSMVSIAQDDPNYIENLVLTWSDEFDGSAVNTDNWTFETGATGWGNNELQLYTNGSNADVSDGKLIITARKVNDNTEVGSYTSSRLASKEKKEFKYGKMEIRAKLPSGTGIWPAIWMLGSNFSTVGWPACGEIDIMEYVGFQPNTIYSTVHTSAGSGGNASGSSLSVPTCEEEFHIYGLLWTENELVFYVDVPENVVYTYAPAVKTPENWPYNQAAFFILNVAVGGNWGGQQGVDNSIFPQSMEIDYVRVYQEAR